MVPIRLVVLVKERAPASRCRMCLWALLGGSAQVPEGDSWLWVLGITLYQNPPSFIALWSV